MNAHATHTNQKGPRRYVPGSSRGRHSATTLLAQVADLERGQRIKARREELHLTQPAVVDLIEKAAATLPKDNDLHPDKAGKAPVSLRGYQTYERGGGIVWAKAKLLAQVLQMDVQAMMQGEPEDLVTPDPFPARVAQDAVMDRLDALDARLADIEALLRQVFEHRSDQGTDIIDRLDGLEANVEKGLQQLDKALNASAVAQVDEIVRGIVEDVQTGKLPKLPPTTPTKAAKTAPKNNRAA